MAPSNKKLFILFLLLNLGLIAQAQICGSPGVDGSGNITTSINTYYPVSGAVNLAGGATSIALAGVPGDDPYGNNFGKEPIKVGDMLLIIQMQDAVIQATNDAFYGSGYNTFGADGLGGTGFTDLGQSGLFEYVIATSAVSLTGGSLTFRGAGANNGTVHNYTNAPETPSRGKRTFQIVRIPQYSNLTLRSDIKTPPFNGVAGGIIAFDVAGIMNFNGYKIDANSRGFRGGYGLVASSDRNINSVYVVNSDNSSSVGKGEGIAGTPRFMWDGYNQVDNKSEGLPNGSNGKGAPGNAGGGGNDHNAGGGGGGNAGFGGVGGNGTKTLGNTPTSFPNGGRPGSSIHLSPTATDFTRIFMGGGGGGGDANNALTGVKGGVGGGIVLINVDKIVGNGAITANGGDGAIGAFGTNPDGAGGGGAGGTIFLKVTNPDPSIVLNIQAKGGKGGNTERDGTFSGDEHGPGGGGGGGQIYYSEGQNINSNTSGGDAGRSDSGNGNENGASDGIGGISSEYNISDLPGYLQGGGSTCLPELNTTLRAVNPGMPKFPGSDLVYIAEITNTGGGNAGGVRLEALLPAGASYKSAEVSFTFGSGGSSLPENLGTPNRPVLGDFNIAPNGIITVTLTAQAGCELVPGSYNTSAQALYLDPTRTMLDPERRITGSTNAFAERNTYYESDPVNPVRGINFNGNDPSITQDNVLIENAPPLGGNTILSTGPEINCVNLTGDPVYPGIINGTDPSGDIGIYTFQWESSPDNVSFVPIAGATLKDYNPDAISSTTFFRRRVSTVCKSNLSNSIVVRVITKPVADFEIPDFCLNDGSATFKNISTNSDGTGERMTYLWNFGDPSSSMNTSTDVNGVHEYRTEDTFQVTLVATSEDGCVSAAKTKTFTVNGSNPIARFTVKQPSSLCSDQPVEFEDRSEISFGQITKIEGYFDFANNPDEKEIDEDPGLRSNPKTYYHSYPQFSTPATKSYEVRMVVYSGASCFNEYRSTIVLHATPEIEFEAVAPVCLEDTPFQIQAFEKYNQIVGTGTFSGTGVSVEGLFDPAAAGPGTHTITYSFISDAGGCAATKSQDINVYLNPSVTNASLSILQGGEVLLPQLAAETGLRYQWSHSHSLSQDDILTPVAFPIETTVYILTVTDEVTGCSAQGTVTVTVFKDPDIPNTFTPNGDGINDKWIIENLSTYTDCTVKIFNRYGIQVFNSVGYLSPWDGTHNGTELPTGVYYYIIDPKKGRKPISGSITILK